MYVDAGIRGASIEDVAAGAGISRATVYYQFGSKAELVDAVLADALVRGGIERVVRAREAPTALDALRRYIPEVCRFWAREYPIFRQLLGMASISTEGEVIADKYDSRRRGSITFLVQRLGDDGVLAPGVAPGHAVDVLWYVTDFRTFEHFYRRCRISRRAVADTMFELIQPLLRAGTELRQPR